MGIATKEHEMDLSLRPSPEDFRITHLGLDLRFTVWVRRAIEVACCPLGRHLQMKKQSEKDKE
jgi:hypothetical protein